MVVTWVKASSVVELQIFVLVSRSVVTVTVCLHGSTLHIMFAD